MQAKAADRNVDRRERAGDANEVRVERDFLVRFAKRRMRIRLPGLDDAAWKRHLPPRTAERGGADSQHEIWAIVLAGKNQYEPRSMTYVVGRDAARPCASRLW